MAGIISRLLDPSRIILSLTSTKRTAALHELASCLSGHPDVVNFDGFYQTLLARDRLDTTCLGNGLAVPHARTEHVRSIVMAVGRSPRGISFGAEDSDAHLLFMLGTPVSMPGEYLKVISALCRLLRDPSLRSTLMSVKTPAEFIAAVVAAEEKAANATVAGAK